MLNLAVQNAFTRSNSKEIKVYERAQLAFAFIDTAVWMASNRVTISWWQWYPKEDEEFQNLKEEVNPTDSEYQSRHLDVKYYKFSVSSMKQRRSVVLKKGKEILIKTYPSSEEDRYAFIH